MELLLRICLTLTKRCHSVDVVWHDGWRRTRTKDFCNILANSLLSLFRGDLRNKIFRGFIKTHNPPPLLFIDRFRICSSCTSNPLCACIRSLWGDLYLYCVINKLLCSLMGLFRMCNTSIKVNDDSNIRLYSSTIWRYSHHRDNVTAPHGRPNLRSRLHFCHAQEGRQRSPQGHVGALKRKQFDDDGGLELDLVIWTCLLCLI